MSGPSVFWPISLLTAAVISLSLSGCGSGRAAIKVAEEKEAAELEATGGRVSSAAGLRLGYGILPEKLADFVRRVRLPFSVNILAEEAGIAAYFNAVFTI